MFCVIGFLATYFDKKVSKDSKITILLMVAGSTILFETVVYIYSCVVYLVPMQIIGFIKILFIEVLFNVLLTIILYPIIKKTGYFFESSFKKGRVGFGQF